MKFKNGKCTYAIFNDAILISKGQFHMTIPYTYKGDYDRDDDTVTAKLTLGDFVNLGGCFEAEFPTDLLQIMDIDFDEILDTVRDYLDTQTMRDHNDAVFERNQHRGFFESMSLLGTK
jgi:hypothetical protein